MRRTRYSAIAVCGLAVASGCGLFLGTDDLSFDGPTGQTTTSDASSTSAQQGTGGTTASTSGSSMSSSGGQSAGGSGSGGATGLIDTNLLSRYFLDEADMGTPSVAALDAAPAPLNLGLRYDGIASYIEINGNRGLDWSTAGNVGDAFADFSAPSTKVWLLQGVQGATIELVVDIKEVALTGSALLFLGDTVTVQGYFGIFANDASTVSMVVGPTGGGTYQVALPSLGRVVLTGVLDMGSDMDLYVNGSPATAVSTMPSTVDLSTSTHIMLGNTRQYAFSPRGQIFYAAIYTAALEPDEVAHNAQLLLANDDTQ